MAFEALGKWRKLPNELNEIDDFMELNKAETHEDFLEKLFASLFDLKSPVEKD